MTEKPLGKRVRRDPNVRIAEEEERRARAQQLATANSTRVTLPSGIVPNPTRHVPDARGFYPLSSNELDADMRAAEKNFKMAVREETESDFPQMNLVIDKTIKPPIGSESTVAKKKMRFVSWLQHPDLLQSEMLKYRRTVSLVNKEYDELVEEDAATAHAMQLVRRDLLVGLTAVREECNKMQLVRNAIGDQLLEKCNLHGKTDFSALLKRKAVGSVPRDIINEISELHFQYIDQLEKYIAAAAEVLTAAELSGRDAPPAPTKGRGKKTQQQPAVNNFELPMAVIELSAEEEAQAVRASLNYRARLAGLHKNDGVDIGEGQPGPEPEKKEEDTDSASASRKSLRRAKRASPDADEAGAGDSSSEVLSRFASVEEQLRFLETTSVSEIVSDLFPSGDAAGEAASAEADYDVSESSCMSKLLEMFFGSDTAAARAKKKPRTGGTASIVMTAKPLLTCPRGVPLLVSPAGLYADRAVGLAANTADGRDGASLSRIPPSYRKPGSAAAFTLSQRAAEQEECALQAIHLRSKIISAEVLLTRLKKDVSDWRATANDVKEGLAYATERHVDTQQYNAADVMSIRAQMNGRDGGVVIESNSLNRPNGEQRSNGFFKLGSDEDFFGNKNGKSKKSKKSSKQRSSKSAKIGGESGMDILSSIAGIAAESNMHMEELSPTQQNAASPLPEVADEVQAGGGSRRSKPPQQEGDAVSLAEEKVVSAKSLRSRR